jgi:hypothetical protein
VEATRIRLTMLVHNCILSLADHARRTEMARRGDYLRNAHIPGDGLRGEHLDHLNAASYWRGIYFAHSSTENSQRGSTVFTQTSCPPYETLPVLFCLWTSKNHALQLSGRYGCSAVACLPCSGHQQRRHTGQQTGVLGLTGLLDRTKPRSTDQQRIRRQQTPGHRLPGER